VVANTTCLYAAGAWLASVAVLPHYLGVQSRTTLGDNSEGDRNDLTVLLDLMTEWQGNCSVVKWREYGQQNSVGKEDLVNWSGRFGSRKGLLGGGPRQGCVPFG
jgi:hypothetical protein